MGGGGGNEIGGSQDKLFPTNTNLHLSGSIASASGRKSGEEEKSDSNRKLTEPD